MSLKRTLWHRRCKKPDEHPEDVQNPSIYIQNIFSPYAQYSTNQPTLPNNYPIEPNVKFRRLPFYDILGELLKPSSLLPQTDQRMQEGTFYFHLTPQQATDIAISRDMRPGVKCHYAKQVQMRFCLLETTCEQEDYFPPNVIVKVNNKPCPLPNPIPTNKPGVEPKRPPIPVNITPIVKLSPTVVNTITVSWTADYERDYAISVALVHELSSQDLLQRLKNKGAKHSDHTRDLIKEKLSDDGDCEIATTSLKVSLMCPLGKMRMTTPCRAFTCTHLQCFDASLFLQMNERKATWLCPVCDKPALYDNLVIDGYFQEVLNSAILPSDANEIQLHKDEPLAKRRAVVNKKQILLLLLYFQHDKHTIEQQSIAFDDHSRSLISPSPPRSRHQTAQNMSLAPPVTNSSKAVVTSVTAPATSSSCMMAATNGNVNKTHMPVYGGSNMPFLDLETDAASAMN